MPSHRKGDLSATAKAEGLSPEIVNVARGQALHFAETRNGLRDNNGERNYGVPGSETVAGKSTVMPELGRSVSLSEMEHRVEAEKATKREGGTEVGSAHSSMRPAHVEGADTRTPRESRTAPNTEFGITQSKLALVTEHARRDRQFRFTSLHHLLNKDFLRGCFHRLDKKKAVGIDDVTWEDYSKDLEENLDRLIQRIGRRAYKPLPSKRVYIPKNERERRPLGISAIETKTVESAVTRILASIYEVDFLPCSYGFRPGLNCHDALDALDKAIMFNPVNHIVEADIRGFFDNVSHERLMEFLKIRIGDTAMLELIGKFLKAGFIDRGTFNATTKGTPQGSILSPLLSNVFLHYTLDVWFENTVRGHVNGYVKLVRYADDFVIVVQSQDDAQRIEKAVKNRFEKYGLEIHQEKSRRMSFGRYEKENAERHKRKPNTFDFLGFTHFCDKTRKGNFKLGRKTQRKKFAKACKSMHEWLKDIRNQVKTQEWWETLKSKLRGHFNYYGLSGNYPALSRFYFRILQMTRYWMNRRSQKKSLSGESFQRYLERYPLPKPEIKHAIYVY